MDIYHIWCNLKPDVIDLDFVGSATQYLDHLKHSGELIEYRIMRRKLGLGPKQFGEFHLMLEFADLTQLDSAFNRVVSRQNPVESFHQAVIQRCQKLHSLFTETFPITIATGVTNYSDKA